MSEYVDQWHVGVCRLKACRNMSTYDTSEYVDIWHIWICHHMACRIIRRGATQKKLSYLCETDILCLSSVTELMFPILIHLSFLQEKVNRTLYNKKCGHFYKGNGWKIYVIQGWSFITAKTWPFASRAFYLKHT